MKRLIPFFLTTVLVLLSIGLVTAFRSGLISRLSELDRRERCAAAPGGSAQDPEHAEGTESAEQP